MHWTSNQVFTSILIIYGITILDIQIAIENGHRNSGVFPLSIVIFHSYVGLPKCVYIYIMYRPGNVDTYTYTNH